LRAHNNRAQLFAAQNDWNNERLDVLTILALAPNDSWAKEALEAAEHQRPLSASDTKALPDPPPADVHPNLLTKVEPEYTDEARRAGVNATIICSLTVAQDGVPQDIRVVRGAGFGLDENAIRAVGWWRFQPATRQGKPVAAKAQVALSFRLLTPNHDDQFARLSFTLPDGANRPQLVHGRIPENPTDGSSGKLRLALTVGTDGKLQDLLIVETNSDKWAEGALREIKGWRFHPATVNGEAVEVKGILEVQRGAFPAGPSSAGPDPAWQPKSAEEFLARGYARLKSHRNAPAEADAEDVLERMPGNVAALFLHGRAAFEDKDYQTAIDDFGKVLEQKPDWPEAYRFRGLAYSAAGSADRAVADFQRAIQLDPNLTPAYNGLGHAYLMLGQLELSKQNLDRAIELEPDFLLARENRAKLFAKEGDVPAEQNELELILALSPNNQWAKDEQEASAQRLRALPGRN
jgi:TonB family protein